MSLSKSRTEKVYSARYVNGEDGYIVVRCPELPGCMSQGRTLHEARQNIREAIAAVLIVKNQDKFTSRKSGGPHEPTIPGIK